MAAVQQRNQQGLARVLFVGQGNPITYNLALASALSVHLLRSRPSRFAGGTLAARFAPVLLELISHVQGWSIRRYVKRGTHTEGVGRYAVSYQPIDDVLIQVAAQHNAEVVTIIFIENRPDRLGLIREIAAIVSRGGRPDLAGSALAKVRAPTLLIVGGNDPEVLALNRSALAQLKCEARLEIVPGATHLFGEPGALESVALLAARWFEHNLQPLEPMKLPPRTK